LKSIISSFCRGNYRVCRDFAISVANALPVLFEKLCNLGLRYTEMRCFERLPNFFAARESSGIIAARFMADKILEPCSFPPFRWFVLFHKADRRIAP
jgi:hypothetical protein